MVRKMTASYASVFLAVIVIITSQSSEAFSLGLSATNHNCTNEGQEVVVNIVADNPCFTCKCKDGHVQCDIETCPNTTGCYVQLQQQQQHSTKSSPSTSTLSSSKSSSNSGSRCCPVCKGCNYKGVHYNNGAQWNDPDDPCQTMQCQGGVVTVSRQVCQLERPDSARMCGHEQHVLPPRIGECCARCRSCRINSTNQTLSDGETIVPRPERDPCVQCTCTAGSLICTRQTCPVLPCPSNKSITKPGTCCPVCQGVRKELQSDHGRCQLGKKMFPAGVTFRPDPCTNCTCQADTTTVCVRTCANNNLVAAAGSYRTPVVIELPQRQEATATAAAAAAAVALPVSLPASRPLTCAYRGTTHQDGATWSLDPCTQCSCAQGQVHCAVQQCPVYRPKAEKNKHKMAALLSARSSVNSVNGFPFGSQQQQQQQQQQPAGSQPCPPGRHPVKEPGQCCPKCVEDDAVCTVFGDPHYRTFDGRVFNFQGSCKYLLAADCRNHTFSVRVTNDARSSRSFSWTKTVTLTIEDLKVTLGQNMKVKVNRKRVSLPFVSLGVFSIVQEGYSVIVRTNLGVKLLWDGESFLEVTVPPAFKRRLCGLCGNFNGQRRDDLRMRNGQLATSVEQFGTSWKVGGSKSCGVNRHPNQLNQQATAPTALAVVQQQQQQQQQQKKQPGSAAKPAQVKKTGDEPLCQRQWHVRIRAVRECSVLKAATFAQCHSQVSPVRYFKSCLLDMCECPPGKQCYCEALTAYAHECARHGVTQIDAKWREATGCAGHHQQRHQASS